MPLLLILLNPFNLVALAFSVKGLAIWGVGGDYKLDLSLLSLFKIFGVPTLVFASAWMLLRLWKRPSNWKLYLASTALSIVVIVVGSQMYWAIVGR